nr:H131 [uncultured bacterium]ART39872.1 J35 [uncultured bacterium]
MNGYFKRPRHRHSCDCPGNGAGSMFFPRAICRLIHALANSAAIMWMKKACNVR